MPAELVDEAVVPGLPRARYWGDDIPPYLDEILEEPSWQFWRGRKPAFLAISGGGQNGAFTAGLLKGWSETGNRPQFMFVSGVSTGALIAPFAFLGSDFDDELETLYTQLSTSQLVDRRGRLSLLRRDATRDPAGLRAAIEIFFTEDMMNAIAAESRKGRVLQILTTNLDAQRPVVWSIGRIAASGAPNALELIRSVMLASASIPVAFPPVMIGVEAQGRTFDEMHVDGGIMQQLFVYPRQLDWAEFSRRVGLAGPPDLYVIRNGKLTSQYGAVERRAIRIGVRSITSVIDTQGAADVEAVYLQAQRDGLEFHLARIPDDFEVMPDEDFDPSYMSELFSVGYELGASGTGWLAAPPNYSVDAAE